jgi:uncharacterized protein (TIGR03435 family)
MNLARGAWPLPIVRFGASDGVNGLVNGRHMARRCFGVALAHLIVVLPCAGFGQPASHPPEFEVAEVRLNNSGQLGVQGGILSGGQVSVRNIPIKELIVQAYKAAGITGGPNWLDSERFDIIAKAPPNTSQETLLLMLQTLLTERFKLAIHREQKTTTVYALVAGKGGFKLQPAAGSGPPKCSPGQGAEGLNHTVCTNFTMGDLAGWLPTRIAPSFIDRPVVDLTGLKGAFDIKLDWVPRPLTGNVEENGAVPTGSTVFDALDQQLGLKLEERRLPMPVIVIDHIERVPAQN